MAFAERADFYLCLSRAFLPPGEESFNAMKDLLADDLEEIASDVDYPIADSLAELRTVMGRVADPLALLQAYSGLFLQPPRQVPINASLYLDGAIMGRSTDAMERIYRNHGMQKAEGFRDLPDHLALLLEFIAYLFDKAHDQADAEDARAFIREFLLSWVPVFVRQLEKATGELGHPPVYLHLARVLRAALIHDAGEIPEDLWRIIDPDRFRGEVEKERAMALCRDCGAPIAPAGRMRRVKRVLEKEGIDTTHLDLCLNCRGSPRVLLGRLIEEQGAGS